MKRRSIFMFVFSGSFLLMGLRPFNSKVKTKESMNLEPTNAAGISLIGESQFKSSVINLELNLELNLEMIGLGEGFKTTICEPAHGIV